MHVRVVRFTDVAPERIDEVVSRVEEEQAPPEGAPITGMQLLYDESQRTAVVLQLFDSAADMQEGDKAFGAMDPSETPGTRASVDMTEQRLELGL